MPKEAISEHKVWLNFVKEAYDKHSANGTYQIRIPEYRPGLSMTETLLLPLAPC